MALSDAYTGGIGGQSDRRRHGGEKRPQQPSTGWCRDRTRYGETEDPNHHPASETRTTRHRLRQQYQAELECMRLMCTQNVYHDPQSIGSQALGEIPFHSSVAQKRKFFSRQILPIQKSMHLTSSFPPHLTANLARGETLK